ncbi:hypothetical protein [Ferruginibacter sp. HRS2-29]|uniref:hypothetical protein n=1 Tax=Ferruginibacter sp. HRS2-29 TaxID=2487334 RepID=UPI0020CE5B0C|nr:hypothetical protein [Ferruginibacter sp. HRS2-29]MCP9751804.1 hypothetical protein [Ferruginibacter sp. HRS2-29]
MNIRCTSSILTFIALGIVFLSCKKDTVTGGPGNGGGNAAASHPNFVCQHQPGSASLNGQFVIFDLDHDANADKKYFIVSALPDGNEFSDSFQVLQLPRPIDSLATGWPAQIKTAAMGTTRTILTDAKNAVTSTAYDPWSYAPISTGTNLYRKLNDPQYAAGKAGQKPYGSNYFSPVYYPPPAYSPYNRIYREITYYFKDGVYTENIPGGGLKSLDTLFVGAGAINWRTVDQTVYIDFERTNNYTRYYRKYFYFDWTNWKYYAVTETEQRVDYLSYSPVYYIRWDVKQYSLDHFCKWPAGWGKK